MQYNTTQFLRSNSAERKTSAIATLETSRVNFHIMVEVRRGIYWMLVNLLVYSMCRTSSATASTAVNVSSTDMSCLPPGGSAWSVTCVVSIPDQTYVMAVHVKALDQFNEHSTIATCSSDTYTFSSFARFMGQSGSACVLPKQNLKNEFNVTFLFTNVPVNSDGQLSVPVRNISCSTVVYSSNGKYEFYIEKSTQDLLQCVSPTIELPPTFHFVGDSAAVVTCSALHGTPKANILLTVTPAAHSSSISVTGTTSVFITINASSVYHKATVSCTVLNHAHYLASKTSEILVHYISRRVSMLQFPIIDTTFGGVLDCSEMVESYPDAKYEWLMDEEPAGRESIFKVSSLSTGKLRCLAINPAANATVSVTYTLNNKLHVVILLGLTPLLVIAIAAFIVWRRCGQKWLAKRRRHETQPRNEAAVEHFSIESGSLNLGITVELTEGVPAGEGDDDSGYMADNSQDAHKTDEKCADSLI